MSRWLRFSGVLGVIVLLFGLLAGFVTRSFGQTIVIVHLVFGLGLIGYWFFQFGSHSLGQSSRSAMSGRLARFGANALLYIVVFVGLVVVINWFGVKYDKRWDLTSEGVYSLSSQSINVIKGLKKPIRFVAFKGIEGFDEDEAKERFELYKYHNSSIVSYEMIDPRTKPHLIERYEMKPGNLIYLEYGDGEKKGVSRINETSEEAITNAIIKLTRGEAKKIYFIQGHDEPDLESMRAEGFKAFSSSVADEHLTVEGILLGEKASVPEDAAALILAAPRKPLRTEEREMVIKYVEGGGRLLLFNEPRTTPDIKEIADRFGIEVGENVIIDLVQRLFAGPALGAQPVVKDYGVHPITRNLNRSDYVIFNIASSVRPKAQGVEGGTYTELAKTGSSAWAETDLAGIFDRQDATASKDANDIAGPVAMAVAYERRLSAENAQSTGADQANFEKVSRVVVFGDSDWLMNANLNNYANRDLILNSINWLVGEEGGISIRPKVLKGETSPVLRNDFMLMLALSFLLIEAILVLGLGVWWGRKSSYQAA